MYKIDSGVAFPDLRSKYPFSDMEVGDSILFKDRPEADSARVCALRYVRNYNPAWKFSLRTVDNGWRLWRVK
jgi:hypothetical protein